MDEKLLEDVFNLPSHDMCEMEEKRTIKIISPDQIIEDGKFKSVFTFFYSIRSPTVSYANIHILSDNILTEDIETFKISSKILQGYNKIYSSDVNDGWITKAPNGYVLAFQIPENIFKLCCLSDYDINSPAEKYWSSLEIRVEVTSKSLIDKTITFIADQKTLSKLTKTTESAFKELQKYYICDLNIDNGKLVIKNKSTGHKRTYKIQIYGNDHSFTLVN